MKGARYTSHCDCSFARSIVSLRGAKLQVFQKTYLTLQYVHIGKS
jgi:hypothetical protein